MPTAWSVPIGSRESWASASHSQKVGIGRVVIPIGETNLAIEIEDAGDGNLAVAHHHHVGPGGFVGPIEPGNAGGNGYALPARIEAAKQRVGQGFAEAKGEVAGNLHRLVRAGTVDEELQSDIEVKIGLGARGKVVAQRHFKAGGETFVAKHDRTQNIRLERGSHGPDERQRHRHRAEDQKLETLRFTTLDAEGPHDLLVQQAADHRRLEDKRAEQV
jgi:hypothetical protein